MSYTLGQAAKATGKSKPTIQRAIKSGRLSATMTDTGNYQIDPAELHRVFEPVTVTSNATDNMKQNDTPIVTGALHPNIDVIRELVANLEDERDDLRRRLDRSETARDREANEREKAAEELRRITLLLTHQSESPKKPLVRTWLWVILTAVSIGAALFEHFKDRWLL